MPKAKLTKTHVDRLQAGATDVIHWDTELTGFGVKVTPKGRKVFLVQYRPAGRAGNPIKLTIGKYGDYTVEAARREALAVISAKSKGEDPQAERRAAKGRYSSDQFKDLVERFGSQHAAQNRSGDETKRILKREFETAWSNKSVHEISKRDVINVLDVIVERGAEVLANRALAAIRKFFNWCKSKDIVQQSPCEGIVAPTRERSRDHVLSDDELRAVIRAAREIGFPFGSIVEAMAFTGQRRDEVARIDRSHINSNTRLWTIPAEHSKNGKAHVVHLSDPVLRLIKDAPKFAEAEAVGVDPATETDLVFSYDAQKPFQGWSKAKRRLDEKALAELHKAATQRGENPDKVKLTPWRLHDLRRTMVTGMMQLGVPHHVADKILNHQSGAISGIAAVYQRAEFLQERQRALDAWARHVTRILSTDEASNIVKLRSR